MKTLIVLTGPTGVGKSAVALELASRLGTEIISADSRQVYAGIPIITAAPGPEDLARVPHHFVGTLPVDAYFSAAEFERQALEVLEELFEKHDVVVVCGGSMLYVDALCHGIDELPTISPEVRARVAEMTQREGAEGMLRHLRELDPDYAEKVDPANLKRISHAVEICLQSGQTYTSLRTGSKRERPFRIQKYCLTAPREVLFDRINSRVLRMIEAGAMDEVRQMYPLRHLNALNTVGFKELFEVVAGRWELDFAVARLQKNTRVYAKKQLTWYARDPQIELIDTTDFAAPADLAEYLQSRL